MPIFATRARRASAVTIALALGFTGALVAAPAANAATFSVTSTNDAGVGSLRQAVLDANASSGFDTITISLPFPATSIFIDSTIVVTDGVFIQGPGAADLLISRSGDFEILEFNMASAGQDVVISGINFDGGSGTTQRGLDFLAVQPVRNLAIQSAEFANFVTTVRGGAINIDGLGGNFIFNSTNVHDNTSTGNANVPSLYAQDIDSGFVSISSSNFDGNSGESGSGLKIMFSDSEVTIANSTFTDNRSTNAGAGLFLYHVAGVTVRNSEFRNNDTSVDMAGSLYAGLVSGSVSIEDSAFSDSSAVTNGGAVVVEAVNGFEIIDSTFTNNGADDNGGAVFATLTGETLVSGSTFLLNGSSAGGAIHFGNVNSSVEIRNSTFDSNAVFGNGGAIHFSSIDFSVTISRTTFVENVATGARGGSSGGAIFATEIMANSVLFVDSSTFSDNLVDGDGVGIYISDVRSFGRLGVLNSTFLEDTPGALGTIFVNVAESNSDLNVENTTLVADGGIRISNNLGDAQVVNSIIDGDINNVGSPSFRVDAGSAIGVRFSALSSAFGPTMVDNGGNQFGVANMMLGALGNNGGPTQTMVPLAGSPVVNTGDPAFVAPPSVDQRGGSFVRVAAGRIDIGAVEFQTAALAATGLEISPLLPIGAGVLLLLGAAAMLLATRRRVA